MNYYERYCGDYASKTDDLTLQEHGAYTLMLDSYYSKEVALPAAYDDLYRICRAMKAAERGAVRKVADRFFPVSGDGLRHNPKADEVLAKAQKRIAAAKANGAKNKPAGLPGGMPIRLPDDDPAGHIGTASRPQTPEETKSKALSGKPDSSQPEKPKNGHELNAVARGILAFLNEKAGRNYREVDSNLDFIVARLKSGATEQQCRQVIAKKVREWLGDDEMNLYLRPETLFNKKKFESYLGELHVGTD